MEQLYLLSCKDPSRYGVINFDVEGKPFNIEEKPSSPKVGMLLQVYIFMIIVH